MSATIDSLLREYHRRLTHFEAREEALTPFAGAQLHGELMGLRGAIGIALDGTVRGGDADRLAAERYALWRESGEADAAACACGLCKEGAPV
ncbi:hypothetical protein ACFVS9_28220 [Streptomyces sp. NPDC058008]|uniref:hypothetical protein n=1 Tax=Streptomyces sp. NPDC058008 TaxID=3346303 RepID=UPI0036EBD138